MTKITSNIGQNKQQFHFRVNEHISYVNKKELQKSLSASHFWVEEHNFNSATITKKWNIPLDLDVFKGIHIHTFRNSLINDFSSVPYISSFWMWYDVSFPYVAVISLITGTRWFFGILYTYISVCYSTNSGKCWFYTLMMWFPILTKRICLTVFAVLDLYIEC